MSRGLGALQRRLLAQIEVAEKAQSASELLATVLLEDFPEGELAALAAARENMASAVRRALRGLKRRKLVHRVRDARHPKNHTIYGLGSAPAPAAGQTVRTVTVLRHEPKQIERTVPVLRRELKQTEQRVTVIRGPTTPLLPATAPAYIRGEDGELQRVDVPTGILGPASPQRRRGG